MDKKQKFFLIYFFGSMFLFIMGRFISIIFSIVMLGQLFFVLGIGCICSELKDYKKGSVIPTSLLLLPMFVIVGFGLMMMPVGFYYSEYIAKIMRLPEDVLLPLCVPIILILAGIMFILKEISLTSVKRNPNYVKVPGVIIDFKCELSEKNTKLYAPIIEYSFNGDTLIYEHNVSTNLKVYKKDDVVDLYVNINNPEDVIYLNKYLTFYLVVLAFVIIAIAAMVLAYIYLNYYDGM